MLLEQSPVAPSPANAALAAGMQPKQHQHHLSDDHGSRREDARQLFAQTMTLPELFLEAQTSDTHVALVYLLHQYNHLVSEYTHLASLMHGLEPNEPIGLGVDVSPATSLTGRIRNLRRRSTRGLRNESNRTAAHHTEAPADVPNIVETMLTVSPKREGTPVLFGAPSHHSPRVWRKSSAPSMSQRIPDSPSQRTVSRQAASPRLSTRSPTMARPQPRKPSSRPTTPLDEALQHTDIVPLAQAEVHVYGSVVRSLQGPDAVGFRIKLLPQADARRRFRTVRAVMTWSDLVALHERILMRLHALPTMLPDRALFDAPYTPAHLSDRNKAVATYLRALHLMPSAPDDLLSQCFAAHMAAEPDVDPVYGTCLQQDDLLRLIGDTWLFCHCALFPHALTIHDPSSHHQPIVLDLRRTRIGRQYEVPPHSRDPNARTTLIVLQRMQHPPSAPIKLATESPRHHSEWMSALLREGEDYPPDSTHDTELFYTPKDTDEDTFPSPSRLDRPTVSVSPAGNEQGRTSLLSRFWYGAEPSSTASQPEKRRFLFGILPLGSSDDAPHTQSVFGMPLADAVQCTGMTMDGAPSPVPVVVKRCIDFLEQPSVACEEGLYRVNGSMSAIKSLQDKFTTSGDVDLVEYQRSSSVDAHTVAGLLKLYFRALPENLCANTLSDAMSALQRDSPGDRLCALTSVLDTLPPDNYAVLCVLCKHLYNIHSFEHANKMTLQNLSIVFSATLDLPTELVLTLLQECQHLFTYPEYLVVNDYADETPALALPERIKSMTCQSPPEQQPRQGHFQRSSDAPLYDPRLYVQRFDDAHEGMNIANGRSSPSTPLPPPSSLAPS